MKKYQVLVPIGKVEPGPGYPVGAVINDKDLPADVIEKFLEAKFIQEVTAADKGGKKDG